MRPFVCSPASPSTLAKVARPVGLASMLLLQLLAGGAASAFGDVVFFGDSLTDTGNTCATVSGLGGGFVPGRCSNGPVWADDFVAALGLGSEATSSASGGSNYANGGARSTNLTDQIDAYTTANGGAADPDALHVVWLGGNDILFDVLFPSGGPGTMQAAAERIGAGIESLAAAGAQDFLVLNAPDVGLVYGSPLANPPFATGTSAFGEADRAVLTGLTIEFNAALDDVLAALTGVSVLTIDATGSFADIIDDPSAFGFSPAAVDSSSQSSPFPIACFADPACAADPQGAIADGFLIFDSVHPTTALHRLIARDAIAAVVPEPSTGLCLAIGLAILARRARS